MDASAKKRVKNTSTCLKYVPLGQEGELKDRTNLESKLENEYDVQSTDYALWNKNLLSIIALV